MSRKKNYRAPAEAVEEVVEDPTEVVEEVEPVKKTVKVKLNVRKFPKKGDNIVRVLEANETVTVYEEIEEWSRISDTQSEYVMTEFLA